MEDKSPFGDGRDVLLTAFSAISDTPERSLCRAVLQDAIEVATGLVPVKSQSERLEAREWLESKSDEWVLSCGTVCELIGINQSAMLNKLRSKFINEKAKKIIIPDELIKSNYRGRVRGTMNVAVREKIPVITEMLRNGKSIREITAVIKTTRFTVCKIRRGMRAELEEIMCGCGKMAGHKGWCRHLYQRSLKRQETMARMLKNQRQARNKAAAQMGASTGDTETLRQTEIVGR